MDADQSQPTAKRSKKEPATPQLSNTSTASLSGAAEHAPHASDTEVVLASSPIKLPRGEHLNLDDSPANRLETWLQSHMIDTKKAVSYLDLLRPEDMKYNLRSREAAMRDSEILFGEMFRSAKAKSKDRTAYTIPICAAMSGIGKSRLLQEWAQRFRDTKYAPQICRDFPNEPKRASFIVTYGNGHPPQDEEKWMGAAAGFAWRLLYAVFLEDNTRLAWDTFWTRLPCNAADLRLSHALDVIHRRLGPREKGEKTDFALFVGIDEFQMVPSNSSEPEPLVALLDALVGSMTNPSALLMIYPMFAGTDWDKISIAASKNSSGALSASAATSRLQMPLLGQQAMRDAITGKGELARKLLESELFCRHLFYLGGVPRPCTKYTDTCMSYLQYSTGRPAGATKKDYKDAFTKNFNMFVQGVYMNPPSDDHDHDGHQDKFEGQEKTPNKRKKKANTGFNLQELISLVAFSVAGRAVQDDEKPFALLSGSTNQHLKFRRLRDGSVCLLDDYGRVYLPYCFFHYLSSAERWADHYEALSEEEKAFMDVLNFLRDYVDRNVFSRSNAPWQQWELFGACFMALRINAILITTRKTRHKLSRVFAGATHKLDDCDVILRPMRVVQTREKFSGLTPVSLSMTDEIVMRNWVEEGLVVLNGESGKGVDIFYTLQLADPGDKNDKKFVLVTDQRKRRHGSVDINQTIRDARVTPGKDQKAAGIARVVVTLFSMFTLNTNRPLPKNSIAVTKEEHEDFHGALYQHPAAAVWVPVNVEGVTALRGLFREKSQECAEKILAARKIDHHIKSFGELQALLGADACCLWDDAKFNCDFTV